MRFLGVLFLVLVLLGLVGWWRGWFTVEAGGARQPPRVSVDEDRIAGDARAAAGKVGELTESVASLFRSKARVRSDGALELDAEVVAVDAERRLLDVRVGDERVRLAVPPDAKIARGNGTVPLTGLASGGRVRLGFREQQERLQLTSIDAD